MSRARVLISNRVPDEGAIGSDEDRCRKLEITALGKACKCFSINPFFCLRRWRKKRLKSQTPPQGPPAHARTPSQGFSLLPDGIEKNGES